MLSLIGLHFLHILIGNFRGASAALCGSDEYNTTEVC